jgi:hypothetical protein
VKRDLIDLLLGIGVTTLGLVVLLFVLTSALAIAQNPGSFLQGQLSGDQAEPPSASFDWSGIDRDVTFTDTSRAGSAAITSWDWDFGDGNRSASQNPAHQYAGPGVYQASLVVEDANGERSTALGQVEVVAGTMRSGRGVAAPGENLNLSFGNILLPVALAFLTFGLYIVMALVGGAILKAGWNLVKPKPETIKVRLKPKHLTQAIEEDQGTVATQAPTPPPPKA